MPIAAPLSLADLFDVLPVESGPLALRRFEELAGTGDGEWLTLRLMPDLWEIAIRSNAMEEREAIALMSRLNFIGHSETAYFSDKTRLYPYLDPGGLIYAAAAPSPLIGTVASGRRATTLTGMPAGYQLSAGDLFQVVYGTTRRALHEVVDPVTADGSGDVASFQVNPPMRAAIDTGDAVSFLKPAAKMKIVPGSLQLEHPSAVSGRISLTLRQTLGA